MKLNTQPIKENGPHWAAVNALAVEAFPPEEYLAPATLVKMAQAENFDFLALLDGDVFVGFMAVQTYRELAYLFFLAIDPMCRGKGYGSRAIETLKGQYPGKIQVVDFEMPDGSAANYQQRERRRMFYLRNGYGETGNFLSYLGVDYEIFSMEQQFPLDDFKELMSTLQIEGFHPVYFTKSATELDACISRIVRMERIFDELRHILADAPQKLTSLSVRESVGVLSDYYEGGDWLHDYELDEKKSLPSDLKRGVLSEDGLYDLLCAIRDRISENRM